MVEGLLHASVTAGEPGPVITLSSEADLTSDAQLSALITAQLASGTRHLTVDVSGLRFADSAAVRTLILAAITLKDRGGTLVLLRPQHSVARVLALTGAEHVFTIRAAAHDEPGAQDQDRSAGGGLPTETRRK